MPRICILLLAMTMSIAAQHTSSSAIDDILEKGLTLRWQDDAIGHPDPIIFRDHLKKAAQTHDVQAVLEAAAPDFKGCGMSGKDDLRRYLTEPIWPDFYRSLTEGGILSRDGSSFDSNYAVWNFPAAQLGVLGPETFKFVSGVNVPVFERPTPHSRILKRLSYNLVVPEEPLVESVWQRVQFRRGQSGYIDSKYLIDPIGMSIRMRRLGNEWRLVGIATYCD